MSLLVKDPDSRTDYRVDWGAAYLGANLVSASQWQVIPAEPDGLTVLASGHDGLSALVTIAGGRSGASYALTNRVTLTNGEIDERSITVRVEHR
ncbi:hypothetical protein C7451_103243 [Blastomonas natatoria]|uniref:Uncharacterized protein n=1 Tax=Blastomonas natatoria TaxID=34015 RepID=A0A2V3VDL1_9SPHN|nr:hypothetical protein [Blastomonas natatoria]PXW78135.1 hypothetical protein C7451_103243 [Blastomonas natatoria]